VKYKIETYKLQREEGKLSCQTKPSTEQIDIVSKQFSHISQISYWKNKICNYGKVTTGMVCSFRIPGLDNIFGEVEIFVKIEGVSYIMFKRLECDKVVQTLHCVRVRQCELALLPSYYFFQIEQGWKDEDGSFIINKYIHYY
jgi:hypothetical protein